MTVGAGGSVASFVLSCRMTVEVRVARRAKDAGGTDPWVMCLPSPLCHRAGPFGEGCIAAHALSHESPRTERACQKTTAWQLPMGT